MERQRDGLVPVADTLADLGGPVKAIREAPGDQPSNEGDQAR